MYARAVSIIPGSIRIVAEAAYLFIRLQHYIIQQETKSGCYKG